MKKICADLCSKILLALFLPAMAAYLFIFVTAFAELPVNIEPPHQFLLLFSHFIPMFLLELLLCRIARPLWRLLAPAILIAAPALIFVAICGFHAMGWLLAVFWCVAPLAGSVLAGLVWHISRKALQKRP